MQQSVLKKYCELQRNPTLRAIAEDTGIQLTRVFRLMNGSKMKLYEYQIFQEKIKQLSSDGCEIEKLTQDCLSFLSPTGIQEVKVFMDRKLKLRHLLKKECI